MFQKKIGKASKEKEKNSVIIEFLEQHASRWKICKISYNYFLFQWRYLDRTGSYNAICSECSKRIPDHVIVCKSFRKVDFSLHLLDLEILS